MIFKIYKNKLLVESHVLDDSNMDEKLEELQKSLKDDILSMNVEFKHGVPANSIFEIDPDTIKSITIHLKP